MTRTQSNLVVILLALILAAQVLPGLLAGVTFVGNCTTDTGFGGTPVVECIRIYAFHDYAGD